MHNIDTNELAKFDNMAASWWDLNGDFKPIHRLNPARVDYISDRVGGLFGKKILDLGCGGGILSEALAKQGAEVVGIDMSDQVLEVAKNHAYSQGLSIDYHKSTIEDFTQKCQLSGQKFDVICALEMLEHVPSPSSVISACTPLLSDDGLLFLSTINKTLVGWLKVVVAAEYLLKLVPKGTHEWQKFIRPWEMIQWCEQAGLYCTAMHGYHYNFLTKSFYFNTDVSANYIAVFSKHGLTSAIR